LETASKLSMKFKSLAIALILLPPVPLGLEVSRNAIARVSQSSSFPTLTEIPSQAWNLQSPQPGIQIAGFEVTSSFGPRTAPCPGCSSLHRGIDVGAPIGSPVKAVGFPGETVTVQCNPDDGMGHPWSIQTAPSMPDIRIEVLHLSQCNPGQYPAGAVHSYSGTAGTGPHYHIQVRRISKSNLGDELNGLFPPPVWVVEAVITGKIDSNSIASK
jgi:murein DD-endopeptidase MepM/ murein hydrolase activator NlpD